MPRRQRQDAEGEDEQQDNKSSTPFLDKINGNFRNITSGKILKTPADVQALIDELPYNTGDAAPPKTAIEKTKVVHCLDGALLAAAALIPLGIKPSLVFLDAEQDDGHALCVFSQVCGGRRYYGCIAKSNFVPIRYRCPVYESVRELVMSMFDGYFNTAGFRSLRSYSEPLELEGFQDEDGDVVDWQTTQEGLDAVEAQLYEQKEFKLLTPSLRKAAMSLTPVDERSRQGGMVGIDLAGAFDPNKQ